MRAAENKNAEKSGWQRPTLPRGHPRSTIGARELNCRVRDGAGWTLTALATNTPFFCVIRVFSGQLSVVSCQLKTEN